MEIKGLTVLQAKRYGVFTCLATETLGTVAIEMFERDVSALVVDGRGFLEGIITRTDLLRACSLESAWHGQSVGSAMTVDVVTISLYETLDVVMEMLLQEHIHRVVAVEQTEKGQRPVTVLSAADIIFHMAQEAKQQTTPKDLT